MSVWFDGCSLGKYFVLGNHDRRLATPNAIRARMGALGWVDLGGRSQSIVDGGRVLRLIGNERPWFGTAPTHWDTAHEMGTRLESRTNELRIAIAHTPDQLSWAHHLDAHWFLAGHTHGGQVRVPGVGPLIAPSWHGARYASGIFQRDKMIMHVSRGLSGVHFLRWNCLPEIALLVATPVNRNESRQVGSEWSLVLDSVG